jgi:superfamily I DNA/RNA helicase
MVEAAKANQTPVHEVLARPEHVAGKLSARARQSVEQLKTFFETCRSRLAQPGGMAQAVESLLEESGYLAWIRKTHDPEEAVSRTANVQELVNAVADYEKSSDEPSLDGFLESVALAGDDETEDDQTDDGRGVTLTTIHAAKGLEYPHVHVVGVEQGILPHQRSMETGDVGEERRLLYVAMTRAQRGLTLSFCRTRRKYGNNTPCHPSAFLGEIPPDALRVAGGTAETILNNHR